MKRYVLGDLKNNMYVIGDNEIAIVDAPEGAQDAIDNNLNVKYIFLTHLHYDHVLGLADLIKKFPKAEVIYNSIEFTYIVKQTIPEELYTFLEKQTLQLKDEYILGAEHIKIINTPGHTAGGICLLYRDMLFSGDTLFRDNIGRTDLPGGDYETEITSVKSLVENLNENIKVYPGHGAESTIKHEKNNPYLTKK